MRAQGDTYELVVEQRYFNQQILNVYHLTLTGALASAGAAQADFAAVATAFKDAPRALQHNSLTYVKWTARQVAGAGVVYDQVAFKRTGGDEYTGVFASNAAGQRAFGQPPATLALVLSLKTGLAGRSRQGRVFLAGILGDNAPDANSVAAATADTITAGYNTLRTTALPAASGAMEWTVWSEQIARGWRMVPAIVSGRSKHVPQVFAVPNAADSFAPVISNTCGTLYAPMHRRKPGVGS